MTALRPPTGPDDITRKTELNPTHLAAAALAAMTSAVLGSELGVAGTIIGAAGASVITTVGTAVYESSLQRSKDRVRSLAPTPRPLPSPQKVSRTERSHPAAADATVSDEQLTQDIDGGPQPADRSRRVATLRWGAAVVAALGTFLLAMILITGFEWASGQTVGGNGTGTTIGHVIDNQPGPKAPPRPYHPGSPASEIPSETPQRPDTTLPDGRIGVAPGPPKTFDKPVPTTRPLIPGLPVPGLPGVGG